MDFYLQVKRYETKRVATDSTVLFELIWRDYFRFLSIKCGNSIFHLGGPRQLDYKWSQDIALFESWKEGKTGLFVRFWSGIWRLIGGWELNGLSHASWIMILALIMATGLMEQELVVIL